MFKAIITHTFPTHYEGGLISFSPTRYWIKPAKGRAFVFSGTTVYYGYESALGHTLSKSTRQHLDPQQRKNDEATFMTTSARVADALPLSSGNQQQAEYLESYMRPNVGNQDPRRVRDLVFVVHGIGQGVCSAVSSICWRYSRYYWLACFSI